MAVKHLNPKGAADKGEQQGITVTIPKNNELEKKRKRLEVKEQQDRNVREAEERAKQNFTNENSNCAKQWCWLLAEGRMK